MKKMLPVLFALALVITCLWVFSVPANAANSGACGDNLTWTLDDSGTLTISGTGAMWDYASDSYSPTFSTHPWKNVASYIRSVTIGNNVTSIGNHAFRYCTNLVSVSIPDSVERIGLFAFSHCDSLDAVTIPDSVSTIGDSAFAWCASLTSVTIPRNVKSIGSYAFQDCADMLSITIGDSVESIGESAFQGCDNLKGIWISANNAIYSSDERGVLFTKDKTLLIQAPGGISGAYTIPEGVTRIDNSGFYDCDSLTDVAVGDSVESIGSSAFKYCKNLKSVIIGNGVRSISSSTFYGCINLTSVIIDNKVESIGSYAFYGCTNLTTVTLPVSITLISDYAFSNCEYLSDIYYAGTQEQWDKINIKSHNGALTNATIHYSHSHNYAFIMVEPTCTTDGYMEYTCVCGKVYLETLTRLPHSFVEGVCTVCGEPEAMPGDLDGSKGVDEDDVIYLLQHLLMPEDFAVAQSVDYDKNNTVDEDDVIYLLQHLLMPEDFPLT